MSNLVKILTGRKICKSVWFMRQAGRILPSYQALKKGHSFSDLMNSPDLAAKVTLLPINDLGVDAAILFSDILIVPEALGMGLEFTEKGPIFTKPLTQFEKPSEQLIPNRDVLTHVYNNIDEIIKTRPDNTPLIFVLTPGAAPMTELQKLGDDLGFGKFFTHRTGHGLGLEIHEEPYIKPDNDFILEKGMTFTIEPGIYIPNLGGIRIEDDIYLEDSGATSLTTLSRDLITL